MENWDNLMSKKYQIRDLVNTTDEFGARTFALVSITDIGYRAVAIKNKKRYNLTDNQIACKIGTIPEDSLLLVEYEYDTQDGEKYCLQQAREFPMEVAKWIVLSKLKPGDKIQLVHRRIIFQNAEFLAVNFTKPLFPIRAKIKGLTHDFRLEAMILEN